MKIRHNEMAKTFTGKAGARSSMQG
ncbi:hypothetical protein HNP52_001263 [Sphingomonas kyeonggiensis]|uniref:Uncharacterized protein n=1 Tax=Sphingomonas kyeonggiensis TaxID=1268553 RepID=A0A7W7K025_9SPHN|nr:hypothetical protein [Sphingomonas kyeonggiensis]